MLTKNSSSVFGVVTTLRTGRYKSITDSNKSDRFVYSPNREDRLRSPPCPLFSDSWGIFYRVLKWARDEANGLLPHTFQVKKNWSYTSNHPHTFTAYTGKNPFRPWNNFGSLLALIYSKLLIIQTQSPLRYSGASPAAKAVLVECVQDGNSLH
jgi:hypothetical protein